MCLFSTSREIYGISTTSRSGFDFNCANCEVAFVQRKFIHFLSFCIKYSAIRTAAKTFDTLKLNRLTRKQWKILIAWYKTSVMLQSNRKSIDSDSLNRSQMKSVHIAIEWPLQIRFFLCCFSFRELHLDIEFDAESDNIWQQYTNSEYWSSLDECIYVRFQPVWMLSHILWIRIVYISTLICSVYRFYTCLPIYISAFFFPRFLMVNKISSLDQQLHSQREAIVNYQMFIFCLIANIPFTIIRWLKS